MKIEQYYEQKIKAKLGLSSKRMSKLHSSDIEKRFKLKNKPLPHRNILLESKRGMSEHPLYEYYTKKEESERKHILEIYSR